MQLFKALWAYRDFIGGMVKRDFRSRYTRSLLGGVWAIVDPLSMIIIYTVIFSQVMRSRLPGITDAWSYSIYICVGIVCWEYFTETIIRGQGMFLDNANLLKKMNFPRTTLPVIVLATASVNFVIIMGIFCFFLLIIGRWPGWSLLGLFPLLIIQQTIAMGLGLISGTLNSFFRDVGQTMAIILRFWFWLTPIVYPETVLPDKIRHLLHIWNPMARLTTAYHDVFLAGTLPDFSSFIPLFGFGLSLLTIGFFIFTRLAGEMIDEL